MFENCGGCETLSYTRFVLSSGDLGTAGKKAENPLNNAEAEVTAAMMGEIFPNLQPGTQEHKEKGSVVNFLRLLARRFHNPHLDNTLRRRHTCINSLSRLTQARISRHFRQYVSEYGSRIMTHLMRLQDCLNARNHIPERNVNI